jgi:alpha-glucosidase (family GH31 glycosyl hydrolase)
MLCLLVLFVTAFGGVNPLAPADPAAIVVCGNLRITVLSEQLFRFEFSSSKVFDDSATFVVVNRLLPVPVFNVSSSECQILLKSGTTISYNNGGSLDGVEVSSSTGFVWNTKSPYRPFNGTYQALDYEADNVTASLLQYWAAMQPGVLSQDGFTLLDDTQTSRFAPSKTNWTWWKTGNTLERDVYLIVYPDLNYKAALASYISIAGSAKLPPRRAFGVFWSLYHEYSATSFVSEVLAGYANNSLPLDAVVLDMDWHKEVFVVHFFCV